MVWSQGHQFVCCFREPYIHERLFNHMYYYTMHLMRLLWLLYMQYCSVLCLCIGHYDKMYSDQMKQKIIQDLMLLTSAYLSDLTSLEVYISLQISFAYSEYILINIRFCFNCSYFGISADFTVAYDSSIHTWSGRDTQFDK